MLVHEGVVAVDPGGVRRAAERSRVVIWEAVAVLYQVGRDRVTGQESGAGQLVLRRRLIISIR